MKISFVFVRRVSQLRLSLAYLSLFLSLTLISGKSFGQNKYWVFFKDKPNADAFSPPSKNNSFKESAVSRAESYLVNDEVLTQRSIQRRLKVLSSDKVISSSDFPVYGPYLDSLRSIGLTINGTSRWFDAASVFADSSQLLRLEKFPFVVALKRIKSYTSPLKPETPGSVFHRRFSKKSSYQPGDSSFYGPSITQFALSGIPQVHALGINGSGVLIGMLDAGFRYEMHEALENTKIVGEHDFIQNDSITENQAGDAEAQDNHGTSTLSVLGGYAPGNLVGVAYGSDFMLAKTEYVPVSDYKWEEDNWVEGIEWMEARGVDVVSSSVGYDVFVDSSGAVDSSESYFWSRGDFNGKKSIASSAATRAAELGVVVAQAAGNEGNGNGVIGTLIAPADADSVITVGAVDLTGQLASFSSSGPTSDGRIKPDLVAMGEGDYVAVVPGPDTYAYESGTSFSTPITAGIAALILSVRPDFTPLQVISLLKNTAVEYPDQTHASNYPNNYYGWGIVNAWNAIKGLGLVSSNNFSDWQKNSSLNLAVRAFSTSGINLNLSKGFYSTDGLTYTSAAVSPTDTMNQYAIVVPPSAFSTSHIYFYFSLVDSGGRQIAVPFYGSRKPFDAGWVFEPSQINGSFLLLGNYPNPFNSRTHVAIVLKSMEAVNVDVYDVLGRRVKTIFGGSLSSGYHEFVWNGTSNSSQEVSSGAYFIRINVGGEVKMSKVLYLK